MSVWGKVVGGAAGFALGGPLGALLGAAAGQVSRMVLHQGMRLALLGRKTSGRQGPHLCASRR